MYDGNFYDIIRPGCQSSAAVVAPLVYGELKPQAVVDVGCGEGWWGAAFADLGCDVLGLDGDYVENRAIPFQPADLTRTVNLGQRFDLAVCLEVAEHLPRKRAAGLVADLTNLADAVLFSAAIPGQGGVGHVNEQWPAYWTDLFDDHGWETTGALRFDIWTDDRVKNWYRQNLILAAPTLPDRWPAAEVLPLVHPVLWDSRR